MSIRTKEINMERNKTFVDDDYVMILNDGETYTALSGCCVALVLWDNDLAPEEEKMDDVEFEALVKSYESKLNMNIWVDRESYIIAEIVSVFE
jgi:hypothetical protein